MNMRNIASGETRNEMSKTKKNDFKSHDIELGSRFNDHSKNRNDQVSNEQVS